MPPRNGSTTSSEASSAVSRRRLEQRLLALTRAAAEIVWFSDREGNVTESLPSLEEFTGRGFAELAGRGWAETIHPDDQEALLAAWRSAMDPPTVFALEYRMRRADGEYRVMRVRSAPVLDDDG